MLVRCIGSVTLRSSNTAFAAAMSPLSIALRTSGSIADIKLEYASPTWLTPNAPPATGPPTKKPIKAAPATSLETSIVGSIRCKVPSR